MSFVFKKKVLSSIMAATMAAGFAASQNANAVHLAADGTGQILMAPLYLAEYGYNTKVAIVNTRSDVAVKARVALRSHVNSIEFDFLCYMTPSDVCRFEIERGADGQAYLVSTDDSLLADIPTDAADYVPVFASQCADKDAQGQYLNRGSLCKDGRLVQKVFDQLLPVNKGGVIGTGDLKHHIDNYAADMHPSNPDSNEIGHVEVIGVWGAKGDIIYNDVSNFVTIKEGMPKPELFKIFGNVQSRNPGQAGDLQNRANLARYNPQGSPTAGRNTAPNGAIISSQAAGYQDEASRFAHGRSLGTTCEVNPQNILTPIGGTADINAFDISKAKYYGSPCLHNTGEILHDGNGSRIRSTDPTWIQLFGTVEMANTATNDRMGLQMAALTGDIWDNLMPANHAPAYGMYSYQPSVTTSLNVGNRVAEPFQYAFDGRVISSPTYDADSASIMYLGWNAGGSRAGIGNTTSYGGRYDNIVELEHALATTNFYGLYENDGIRKTNLVVTFPTKYVHRTLSTLERPVNSNDPVVRVVDPNDDLSMSPADVCASEHIAPSLDNGEANASPFTFDGKVYYPPFRMERSGSVVYGIRVWDDQEHPSSKTTIYPVFSGNPGSSSTPTITDEVNYMWMNWPTTVGFHSGWFNMSLTAERGCQYAGVPALAFAHKTQLDKDGNFINSWLTPLVRDVK